MLLAGHEAVKYYPKGEQGVYFFGTGGGIHNIHTQNQTWFGARFENKLPHDISVGIWSHADNLWRIKTVKASEILVLSESWIIYVQIQGDMIGDLATRRLTHTYEGIECYQLETSKFDSPPEQSDLDNAPLNRLEEIMGGQTPKTVTFLDKTKLQFELFGPSGIKLKIICPVNDGEEGQAVYSFQLNSD